MGNWVCRFGFDSVLKNVAVLFENCDEDDVREKMAEQFVNRDCHNYWSSIVTLDEFNKSKYKDQYVLVKGVLN